MSSYKKRFFMLFATIAMLIVSVTTVTDSHSSPNAFDGACSTMGAGMEKRDDPKLDLFMSPSPDASNRKWTVEELFKGSINYTSYYGEGPKKMLYQAKVDRGLERDWITEEMWKDPKVQANVNGARTLGCAVGRINIIPQLFLRIASGLTSLTNSITSTVIGEDFMAKLLMNVIGGKGDNDDGIIGALYNNIYTPLVIIAVIIMAVTIIYKGLIKMQYREAMNSLIWSTAAFIIGVALMMNPRGLVELPQKATSTITTCVMGAISGQNCMTGEVSSPEATTGTECRSQVGGDNADEAGLMMNGMNCTIWKSFILEKWADEQFGVPYNQLYTYNAPPGGKIWNALPEGEGKRYCVNLESSQSASELDGNQIVVDGGDSNTVCNVALYQLYLQTNMQDNTNHESDGYSENLVKVKKNGKDYDARWFDIIVPMASDDSNWDMWTGVNRLLERTTSSLFSIVTVLMASVVIISLGVLAAVYKVTGIVTMAFAPLFLLFAIEPSRGRKIFLGWIETLVSALLKYFAVTMLLVVSVTLYAGVLNNTSGFASLVAVTVLTFTMIMYRKEIVDLIGTTNMGGQRLSNKVDGAFQGTKKQAKEKGMAYTAGKVGGRIGAASARNQEIDARENTLTDLKSQLATATTEEGRERIERNISSEEESLKEIGHGKLKAEKGASKEEKKAVRKENKEIRGNKKDILKDGKKQGGSDALGRAMRRGTSFTANTFRQKQRISSAIEKDLVKARAENESASPEEIVETARIKEEAEELVALRGSQRKSFKTESTEFKGHLSDRELRALSQFSDEISAENTDENLVEKSAKEEDENKKIIIANEINARVKSNAIQGKSSTMLATSSLVNKDNLSNPDLEFRSKVKFNDYLETGDKESLKDYTKTFNQLEEKDEKLVKNLVNPVVLKNNKQSDFAKLDVNKNPVKLDDKDIPKEILKEREDLIKNEVIKKREIVLEPEKKAKDNASSSDDKGPNDNKGSNENNKGNNSSDNKGPRDNNKGNNSNDNKGPNENNKGNNSSDNNGPRDNNKGNNSNDNKGPNENNKGNNSNDNKGPNENNKGNNSSDNNGPRDNNKGNNSNDNKGPNENNKGNNSNDNKGPNENNKGNNSNDGRDSKKPFSFGSTKKDTEMLSYLDQMNIDSDKGDSPEYVNPSDLGIKTDESSDMFIEEFISGFEDNNLSDDYNPLDNDK